MFYLISGGSGSGKSKYAEDIAVSLRDNKKEFAYIATMMAYDKEAYKKIEKHREMRKDKGFTTYECFTDCSSLQLEKGSTALLDCMSNLVANEMFDKNGAGDNTVESVITGIKHLLEMCEHLVVVTNDVAGDGKIYDETTMEYIKKLNRINCELAKIADHVIEVVYTIPVYHK